MAGPAEGLALSDFLGSKCMGNVWPVTVPAQMRGNCVPTPLIGRWVQTADHVLSRRMFAAFILGIFRDS